ncbi:MAG: hypothetical protein LC789_07880 [Actinobacteria bacterium]|nr:hypothetical protein [Actinomycetota bacterium]MCA1719648.1 hypothetical protein [Actinomycetota bacterium]
MRRADPVRTMTFHLRTPACSDTVWRALTCSERSPRYLGLALRTSWQPGAGVVLSCPAGGSLTGEVLHVEPGVRLSLVLEEMTYLTWTIRGCGESTVVRLQVDEPGSTETELEDVWLPVLERLAELLRAEASPAG